MGFKIFPRRCAPVDASDEIMKKPRQPERRRIISLWGGKSRPAAPKYWSKKAASLRSTGTSASWKSCVSRKYNLGGKYLSKEAAKSMRSIDKDDEPTEISTSWKSCASRDYSQGPAVSDEDKRNQWHQALLDARRLPRTSYFSSNHIMVNKERAKRIVPALKRSCELDAAAKWHAESMAADGKVRHSDARELQSRLEDASCFHLGENVAVGENIRAIHQDQIDRVGDLRNMMDPRFKEMGMATARGADGQLFLCQIFRG